MRLSTRARYGARVMLDLALNYGHGLILLKDVAKREELPGKYLSQIVIPLRAQGLIVSGRGAKGGYMLARQPAEITMKDIVEALDGELVVTECARDPRSCDREEACVTKFAWRMLGDRISEALDSMTLQDLVEMHHAHGEPALTYEI
ncbi:Rrf2 family transcriptional regulator [bacterium]|nr:Rrf2 family transcriptional regulator [bacterium]